MNEYTKKAIAQYERGLKRTRDWFKAHPNYQKERLADPVKKKKHSKQMKAWRKLNPGYMKRYYATHPLQCRRHNKMVKDNNKKLRGQVI
jgi:hypothetical protein